MDQGRTKDFAHMFAANTSILMEGALSERLKREYRLKFDEHIAMANLIDAAPGRSALRTLWKQYAAIASRYRLPFLATTPTRRANRERMQRACRSGELLLQNAAFLREIQAQCACEMYIGGLMGCKGDAYTGADALSAEEAFSFHAWQAEWFQRAGVDFLYAGILPVCSEAIGMARAMEQTGIPYMISFTIQADGNLIDGTPIDEAIDRIDAATTNQPVCYMTNCVHPRIVRQALLQPFNQTDRVRHRFGGVQANTSPLPYAQLDHAQKLYTSPPEELAEEMLRLREILPLKIFGGCCGTDARHMEAIARRLSESVEMR